MKLVWIRQPHGFIEQPPSHRGGSHGSPTRVGERWSHLKPENDHPEHAEAWHEDLTPERASFVQQQLHLELRMFVDRGPAQRKEG